MEPHRLEPGSFGRGPGRRGPLAAAVATLEDPAARPACAAPPDPATFLARLMDLHGSVSLARELAALERPAAEGAAADGAQGGPRVWTGVRALVTGRLDDLARATAHTFADPFQRRNKLPAPGALHALLEQHGLLEAHSGRALSTAAEGAWEPFGELAARALGRVRFETRALREEIAPLLRAAGPAAARIERLDAALSIATEKGRERVLGALAPGLARAFTRRLRAAITALPQAATAGDVAGWFAPDAWLREEIARMERVVQSALSHEAGRLLSLTDAACAAASA